MGVLSACGTNITVTATPSPEPCLQEDIEQAISDMEAIALSFTDAVEEARRSSRDDMPPIVSDMAAMRQAALGLKPPHCATTAHTALVDYMTAETDAFSMMLGNRAVTEFVGSFLAASKLRSLYIMEIETLRQEWGV